MSGEWWVVNDEWLMINLNGNYSMVKDEWSIIEWWIVDIEW